MVTMLQRRSLEQIPKNSYRYDVERILQSKAYSRYIDKTQVIYLVENDHITHRSLHVQLVSSFARGIAEALGLNIDLVEAIALGHDVGHSPFGHEGEDYLSELSQEFGNGPFAHSLQSCRLFSVIEPLNLALEVYDGFLCHDGGMKSRIIEPNYGKTWDTHEEEKKKRKTDPNLNLMPGTLEGCVVKLCDTISYLARDIEDAIHLGIIQRHEIPDTILGNSNESILHATATNIVRESQGKPYIALEEPLFQALSTLRSFNFEKIYFHPKLKVESKKIKRAYRLLFENLLAEYRENPQESYLWKSFLYNKNPEYTTSASPVELVVDYIAGMTDSFFVRTLEKIFIPKRIDISP